MTTILHGLVGGTERGRRHHRNPISPFLHLPEGGEVTHGLQKGPPSSAMASVKGPASARRGSVVGMDMLGRT